ncbi:Zn-dependent exopeptidase [Phlegmacium glaucopus]|nr:Zn-dependent exopeptidase [Phlegmacium glaucopus]
MESNEKVKGNALLPLVNRSTPKSSSPFAKLLLLLVIPTVFYGWHHTVSHRKTQHLFGKKAEKAFLSIPNEASAIQASRLFATKPHMAGTPGDLTTAKDFLQLLETELGIHPPSTLPIFAAGSPESQHATRSISKTYEPRAWIDTYYPVMNTPLERTLQISDLIETGDETDPEAAKYLDAVPIFHGLSRGGDVTGKLVDGNYCTKDDFDRLAAAKIDLKGSVVMCRYGGIFRGLKVESGASGVLIYSDPQDDGTVTVENGYEPYPHGPARNPTSVQRGSVQYLSVYPGDPTTPGYPSYENSTRTEGSNIPLIPSLPISWFDASTLFKTLETGHAWEGALVRLNNNVDTRVIPIWNTLGVIPGYIKNEVVVVGNHRDGMDFFDFNVMGATDPSSGTASVHEVVRGLGHLLRKGWRPLRTILIASWDAEEYGLIGSTEWGEDFVDWIDDHVVAYLNLDSSVSGSRLHASASPLLAHLIRDTAEELPHPTDKGRTLWDATNDSGKLFGLMGCANASIKAEAKAIRAIELAQGDNIGVSPLGSGSDYTVFLQRNGIPSTNGGFGATTHDPVYHYHSVFDSERWQELYGDPGFFRHVSVAKHLGLQTLRLSSAPILPFNTTHYAYELESYLNNVEAIATEYLVNVELKPLRNSIHALQKASIALDEERRKAERDLRKVIKSLKKHKKFLKKVYCHILKLFGRKCSCPHRKKSRMTVEGQEEDAMISGIAFHAGFDARSNIELLHHGKAIYHLRKLVKHIQALNAKSSAFERGFISTEGIKDREWYKHLAVAPGKWLGYGATTFPALTEAIIFEKSSTLARNEVTRLQVLIDRIADTIKL